MQWIISCYYVKWLEIKLTLHKKWCDTAAVLTLKAAGSPNQCDLVLVWNGWRLYPLSIFFGPQGNEQVSCSLCLQEKQLQSCSLTPVSSIMAFMLLVLKIALTVIQPLRCGYCAFPKWMEKATKVSYISAGWIPQQEEAFSDPPACGCGLADQCILRALLPCPELICDTFWGQTTSSLLAKEKLIRQTRAHSSAEFLGCHCEQEGRDTLPLFQGGGTVWRRLHKNLYIFVYIICIYCIYIFVYIICTYLYMYLLFGSPFCAGGLWAICPLHKQPAGCQGELLINDKWIF